jgi:hypothetical protein
LWLDDGLKSLITSTGAAQKAQQAALAQAAAKSAPAKAPKSLLAAKLKVLQNTVTKAKAAVKPLSQVQTVMFNTINQQFPAPLYSTRRPGLRLCVLML